MKKVAVDLKPIYKAVSEQAALVELDRFDEIWGAKYPPEIRKIIYTTNIIESYHRQLRKVTKGKSIFPSDQALLKMLYLATMDVVRKWTCRVQLSVFLPDR